MRIYPRFRSIIFFLFLSFFCQTLLYGTDKSERKPYFDLTFAGDIMAHSVNTGRDEYDSVFSDIRVITENDDLTFANFECPVVDSIAETSYPMFNCHSDYPTAAANAGIDVFCLANNHTNDQYQRGIADTWTVFSRLCHDGTITAHSGLQPPVDSSVELVSSNGTRTITIETEVGRLTVSLIEKNGWNILYLAETEMLNDYYKMSRINYIPRTKKNLEAFPRVISELRTTYPCDLFILGVHTDEPEYVFTVTDKRRTYFDSLLKAGTDIIWANHPHVTQEWDIITDSKGQPEKLILYSVGNLISGQRWQYDFDQPHHVYEWIGDSVIMEVSAVDTPDGIRFDGIHPVFATTHRNGPGDYVIKRYTRDFIESQTKQYHDYYTARLSDLESITANIRNKDEL